VRYLACLVNLEGQFDALLAQAPPPAIQSVLPLVLAPAVADVAAWDKVVSGQTPSIGSGPAVLPDLGGPSLAGPGLPPDVAGPGPLGETAAPLAADVQAAGIQAAAMQTFTAAPHAAGTVYEPAASYSLDDPSASAGIAQAMAKDFAVESVFVGGLVADRFESVLDPKLRFPVLLHWSFTTTGDTTFERLMQRLDSGLLGTVPAGAPSGSDARQPPLEVVETGHVGLTHRTREGDQVRAWYRGPLVPHPTTEPSSGRLPLAHASDQLRIVVPDGREDLSLAAAFEIGRLLALAHPSTVAALLRWRQSHYQLARRGSILDGVRIPFDDLLAGSLFEGLHEIEADLGVHLGRFLADVIVRQPGDVLGPPRILHDPGRSLELDEAPAELLAAGLGLDAGLLADGAIAALPVLTSSEVPVLPVGEVLGSVAGLSAPLQLDLGLGLADLVSGALAPTLFDVPAGPTIPRTAPRRAAVRDRLDDLLGPVSDPEPASEARPVPEPPEEGPR
jgi:hypothetical protein